MDNILTANVVELIDAHERAPKAGSSVLALTVGGVLVRATWGKDSLKYYDAWCRMPRVPEGVRARQLKRYAPKGDV